MGQVSELVIEQDSRRYEVLGRLATGGMAEILSARQRGAAGFCRDVVLKRLHPEVGDCEELLIMLRDEARIASRISHPNVCAVLDFVTGDGAPFLVLERLHGLSLVELIRARDRTPFDPRLIGGIVVQACDGLAAAHQLRDERGLPAGVVHRDVSASNLLVTVHGVVKVLDFGIARARWVSRKTRTGTLLGKCEYMSPEQARGEPVDARSDLFSLGVVAYRLACGVRPFHRDSDYETLRAIASEDVRPARMLRPRLSPAFEAVLGRALARDRQARFQTAREMGAAMARALAPDGGPMSAREIAEVVAGAMSAETRGRSRSTGGAGTSVDSDESTMRATPGPALERASSRLPTVTEGEAGTAEATALRVPARTESPASASYPRVPSRGERAASAITGALLADRRMTLMRRMATVALVALVACAALGLARYRGQRPADAAPRARAMQPLPAPRADAHRASVAPPTETAAPSDGAQIDGAPLDVTPSPDAAPPRAEGVLTVRSSPRARLWIDRRESGVTPVEDLSLPPGLYHLKVQLPDGRKKYISVRVRPGEARVLDISNW